MTQFEPGVDAELDRLQLLEVQQDELGAQPIAHLLQQRLAVKRTLLCPQYVPGCPPNRCKASNERLSDAANDHHAVGGRWRWCLGWYSMHSNPRGKAAADKESAHAKRRARCHHVDGTWQVGSADSKNEMPEERMGARQVGKDSETETELKTAVRWCAVVCGGVRWCAVGGLTSRGPV